jgi:hypothetical protein
MKKIIFIISLIIGLITSNTSFGQVSVKSLRFSITGNNLAYIPKYNHPGFAFGVNFMEKQPKHFKKTFGMEFSYYRIVPMEQSMMLDITYSLGYVFNFGLEFKLLADLGYKFSAFTGDVYKFSDNHYVKTNILKGKSQVNLKLGFGLEYPLNQKIAIFLHAKVNGYFPPLINSTSLIMNQELGLGVKFNFNKNKQNK